MLPIADKFDAHKIVIVGISNSGCSSFIEVICDEFWLEKAETLRRINDTFQNREKEPEGSVFDFGRIELPPKDVFYFFTESRGRFADKNSDILWGLLAEATLGFVVIVDSSKPETFNATRNIVFNISRLTSVPFVVAANKQDLPDAWDAEALCIALHIPNEIPVIPCTTHDKKSVVNVVIALCEEVLKDIEASGTEV